MSLGNADYNKLFTATEKEYIIRTEDIDADKTDNVLALIAQNIAANSVVLDVGCSYGYLGEWLKKNKHCTIYGIDINQKAIKKVKTGEIYKDAFLLDLDNPGRFKDEYKRFLGLEPIFDYIVWADVLEHLVEPSKALVLISDKLKTKGTMLVSIPNIANADIIANLLEDRFNYSEIGLLDNTHLRFFTGQSFRQWIDSVNKYGNLNYNFTCQEIGSSYYTSDFVNRLKENYPLTYGLLLKDHPNLSILQYVFAIKKTLNGVKPLRPSESVKKEYNYFPVTEERISDGKKQLRELSVRLNQAIASKEDILKQMNQLIGEKTKRNAELQKDLDEKNGYVAQLKLDTQQLRVHIQLKESQLEEILNSHGWKFLTRYYRLRNLLFPLNSRRRRIGQFIWHIARKVIKLRWLKWRKSSKIWSPSTQPAVVLKELPEEDACQAKEWKLIEFAVVARPAVSIIIPVWNKCNYTYRCLESLLENTGDVSYDVIVVDNASTDETVRMLDKVKNISVIKNETNLGFVGACNKAAVEAKGEYLLILNNDTRVTSGWLKAMVELAQKDAEIGMVGAKLLYPDGRLQEAGGIIWNDPVNLAWNYGRFDDPNKWEYNYVKEVDYCSGACLLIRKSMIKNSNLFDDDYAPAYCEDVDLAFWARQNDYKVMYQPKAEIIHYEGATAGTDTDKGMKQYQVINMQKFYGKWRSILEKEHFKNGENVFLARDRSKDKKVLLFIDNNVPTWDQDAGSVVVYEYLKVFVKIGLKIIFWPHNLYRYEPYGSELQQMGIEVVYGPNDFKKYIKNYGKFIDIAFLTRPDVAMPYIDHIKDHTHAKVIYYVVDLYFLREERKSKLENNPSTLAKSLELKKQELYLISKSDVTLTLSDAEKEMLNTETPDSRVEVIPYIQSVSEIKNSYENRNGLLFLGGFQHPPNADGILWFVREIYPLVKREIPDMTLTIIGSKPTAEVMRLNSPENGINVVGYVKDVTPYFKNARVFVSPLRYGAGIKGKNIQSMSFGLPMVTTSMGAEGLRLKSGEDAFISDNPSGFAKMVAQLYRDKNKWEDLSKNSIEYVRKNNTASIVETKFRDLFGLNFLYK